MKGYKGYEKGLICRGKQYAVGKVFEENNAEICKSGMHFCRNPLDILDYYPLIDTNGNLTEFTEVEALDEPKTDDGKKFCTKKLKIGAKLSLSEFAKASFDVAYENIKAEAEKSADAETGGYNATLAGGDGAKLAGGNYAKLAGGNYAKLAGGYNATLAGGDGATLAGGNHTLIVGDGGSIAKGGIGSVILLVSRDGDRNITAYKAIKIDGKRYKADVYYTLGMDGKVKVAE